jgi:anti-sigma factor RsiW
MNPPSNPLNDDLFTRWIDGELPPKEASLLNERASATPELLLQKESVSQLGELLRKHLPAKLEPPSPEFFTSSVMDEVTRDLPARPVTVARSSRVSSWLNFLRTPWFAPLASAAVVAVAFLTWNHFTGGTGTGGVAQTQAYAPDPNVVATAYYSSDAEATVIDLQHLAPVPDSRDIRAFDVASVEPATPGEPWTFYAASDATRPAFVLSKDVRGAPRIVAFN